MPLHLSVDRVQSRPHLSTGGLFGGPETVSGLELKERGAQTSGSLRGRKVTLSVRLHGNIVVGQKHTVAVE